MSTGLRRFRDPKPVVRAGERCEMCAVPIADEHQHVVNIESRALQCACRSCYLLFTSHGASGGKHRAVPDRYQSLPDFELSPGQWDSLQIPVSGGTVHAEGDLDFRGTLGVAKDAPVGFARIRVRFDLDTDASDEQIATLLRLTERYCVVYQTLRQAPAMSVSWSAALS